MSRKKAIIDFSEYWGGLNLVDSPLNFDKNQVQDGTKNAILTKKGQEKRLGNLGLSAVQTFTEYVKMLEIYRQFSGTEKLLALSDGKLVEVNTTDETLTERFDLTGTGEGVGKSYEDKFWLCNGSNVAKLENQTAYKIGITPPVGATATGSGSGGTLPAGDYQIFISYYRKVSGTIVLYSAGQFVTTVSLSGSTSKIAFTAPDSLDTQVGGVTVWMTDADGDTFYSYHNEDGTGAYSFDILNAGNKNATLLYSVEAITNQVPPAFTYMEFHNNRLYGINPTNKGDVHYSIVASNAYDYERFPNVTGQTNVISYPFEVTGLFSLGDHLYINTKGGFIVQPFGDPNSKWQWVDKRYFFDAIHTVAYWGNRIIGLTNDGVRFFDGLNFSEDLSAKVRPEIDKALSSPANHLARGVIYDRVDKREEYHLTYQDTTASTVTGNRRLVLNLTNISFFEGGGIVAPWELWTNGADYMAVDSNRNFYNCQSHVTDSHIYKEDANNTSDQNVYNELGVFKTTAFQYEWVIISRVDLPSMEARFRLHLLRAVVKTSTEINVEIVVADRLGIKSDEDIGSGEGVARYGIAIFGTSTFSGELEEFIKQKYTMNLKGYTVYIKVSQQKNDIGTRIIKLVLQGELNESVFT